MAKAKFLVFQNQTSQKIFLIIKAKKNGPIKFMVYSKEPKSCPLDATPCDLENETSVKIGNRNYTTFHISNRTGKNLALFQKREGENVNLILEAAQN